MLMNLPRALILIISVHPLLKIIASANRRRLLTLVSIESTPRGFAMTHQPFHKSDRFTRIVIATSNEHLMDAYAVRSICFMEEKGIPARSVFDGNDFQSTHIVVYYGNEPIGTSRVRWFNNFVKIERTAFRKAYRNPRILRETANLFSCMPPEKATERR